jgi:hypothetical protein
MFRVEKIVVSNRVTYIVVGYIRGYISVSHFKRTEKERQELEEHPRQKGKGN